MRLQLSHVTTSSPRRTWAITCGRRAMKHAAQAPLLQKPLHVSPHALQLARVPNVCSQPFESTWSQSPKPRLQLPIEQVPLPHVGVAFVRAQGGDRVGAGRPGPGGPVGPRDRRDARYWR